jgi:hypothetical protein
MKIDENKKFGRRHGLTKASCYQSWDAMIQRCTNKNSRKYKDYGGRGICVDKNWLNFENFYKDMGDRPINTTLNRKNNNGNYTLSNCEWSSIFYQNNNKRTTIRLTINGEEKSLAEWLKVFKLKRTTVVSRLKAKWSHYQALGIISPPLVKRAKRSIINEL